MEGLEWRFMRERVKGVVKFFKRPLGAFITKYFLYSLIILNMIEKVVGIIEKILTLFPPTFATVLSGREK